MITYLRKKENKREKRRGKFGCDWWLIFQSDIFGKWNGRKKGKKRVSEFENLIMSENEICYDNKRA